MDDLSDFSDNLKDAVKFIITEQNRVRKEVAKLTTWKVV
jgi:hypothetical protein